MEIRSGLFRGLSPCRFKRSGKRSSGGVRRIQSAAMTAMGLVDSPSYNSAC